MDKLKILVVDDDRDVLNIIVDYIKDIKDSEYEIQTATSCEIAINVFKAFSPHIVFTDYMMPDGENGFDLLKIIKQMKPDIPVIIVTGFGTRSIAVEAIRGEAFDFIEKPLSAEQIVRVLSRAAKKIRAIEVKRREYEKALRCVERHRSTMASLDDLVFWVDREGRIFEYHQPNSQSLLDFFPEGVVGKNVDKLFSSDIAEKFKASFQNIEINRSVEKFGFCYDIMGQKKLFDTTMAIRTDIAGEFDGVTWIVKDSTECRKSQEQFLQSIRLSAIKNLSSGACHEINNPLMIIKMSINLIADKIESSEISEYCDVIMEAVDRIKDITGYLEKFSYDSGVEDWKQERVDIYSSIKNAFHLFEERLKKHNIDRVLELSDKVLHIRGDQLDIELILHHLVANSLDAFKRLHNEDNKVLKVSTKSTDDKVKIELADNAGGMSKDVINSVFDPFYSTKDIGDGMGVGLALVASLVKRYKGLLSVATEDGVGTKVEVAFPAIN